MRVELEHTDTLLVYTNKQRVYIARDKEGYINLSNIETDKERFLMKCNYCKKTKDCNYAMNICDDCYNKLDAGEIDL